MYSRVGKAIPLYCTAIGKIFLSEMSEAELSDYFKNHTLRPFTAKSIRTEAALREELKRIKERGWSIDDEEHEDNIMCLASPIRDNNGHVLAAISVSWPLFRFDRNNFEHEVKRIKEATAEISRIYGAES